MIKASRKIPWIYSGITICLVVIAGIAFYFLSSHYIENLYYNYLEEKAHLVAIEKFEKDELDPIKYQNILLRKKNTIPTSQELFINLKNSAKARSLLRNYLSEEEINEFMQEGEINFVIGNEVGTAITYYDNSGTYAVLVLSRNPYGSEITSTIGWGVLGLVIFSSLILYLISRLYALRIVERINLDYQTEKLFINNASHEINNPLTAIQGECEILMIKERTPEEYKHAIERISKETDRIIRIMSQLLSFSHTRSENISADTLDKVWMSEFLSQFKSEDTVIDIISDFAVLIREDLLHIALRNIINNAHKYSNQEKVTIKADHNTVTVFDKGIGIPQEDLQHIFEPFFRAGNANDLSGQGIGLFLSKVIIEKFNGKIQVNSTVGKGTAFKIVFKKVER